MLKVYNNSKTQERVCVQLVLTTDSRGFIFSSYMHTHAYKCNSNQKPWNYHRDQEVPSSFLKRISPNEIGYLHDSKKKVPLSSLEVPYVVLI